MQLVITPETAFEKNSLSGFADKPLAVKIFEGTFYDCRGGWVRQKAHYGGGMYGNNDEDKSIILQVRNDGESQP